MLLTISTTHRPASDLGYLLHKHPDRLQQFTESVGTATVVYPEVSDTRCTAALFLDVDPIRLARTLGRNGRDSSLAHYVNDRPYAASSLLSVAMGKVFSTARAGTCKARPDLAASPIPLDITIPVLPCRGGPDVAHRLFAPLGWRVDAEPIALDAALPGWGASRYVSLRLSGTMRLSAALSQLYVLLPALDESKHYWQNDDEVDKLIRSGAGWLADHPEQRLIAQRYLGRRGLVRAALERLAELGDDTADTFATDDEQAPAAAAERRIPLQIRRRAAVVRTIAELNAQSVLDLGCGPGQLLTDLVRDSKLTRITGLDVSSRSLEIAARRLHLDDADDRVRSRISLIQGALTYEDPRLRGYDVAVLMEVIEHIDPPRLGALEHVVFAAARPGTVIVTTPNSEYNVNYEGLTGMRHPDHRFEWTRAEFDAWTQRVAAQHEYSVRLAGIGDVDDATGAPTQMAVFTRD
ncbi:3' terminal RNA ribose 2'-O-methyltransferase Hen1 [Gordonia sp. TBRC 11910]|uniref:Small RNA 2'-O-methyltransferase n=1 Tax=Gordonia asplenii TaxID=2725283 RepID=A0A848KY29_9ACTN|nr:3' terminal RNA ribose 2'-O-methyltransferase Hen1 [Gordonia asplenii]